MSKKVVICGVDTSTLPRLTVKESKELLLKIESGDETSRRKFIIANLRLVLSVVQRYSQRVSNLDDLFQVGCVGLVKSVDNFDNSLNVRFSTYAVPMIVGEIRRYLRESNSLRISRGIRDVAYQALQAREALERTSGAEVSIEQISEQINIPVKQIVYCLEAINEPVSLFEPVYNDGNDAIFFMDQLGDKGDSDNIWVENVTLAEAITKLNNREKDILLKRYYEGKTQMEVSNEVGISQAQVSRLEKNAVEHIREIM